MVAGPRKALEAGNLAPSDEQHRLAAGIEQAETQQGLG